MALSTIGTAGLADDAVTAAKIDDDGTGFTFGDVTTGALTATGATTGIVTFDKLTLDGSSVATVTVNGAVSGSTTVAVDGVSGTIAVGMVVNVSDTTVRSITDASSESAISVDDTLTITAVASQTSFTVSEAVSIADNVVLILRADENSKMVLDASAASTDVGDEILFEDATSDVNTVLNSSGTNGSLSSVIQVVQGTKTDDALTTSTTYESSGLFVQITPKSTSSKILVSFSAACHNNTATKLVVVDIARDPSSSLDELIDLSGGTLLSGKGASGYGLAHEYSSAGGGISQLNAQFLDSPSTTNQITYLVVFRAHGSGSAVFNVNSGFSTVTAMEIAG